MTAEVLSGADFRSKSTTLVNSTPAPAPVQNKHWTDVRTLQEARRQAEKHAQVIAILADRCVEGGVKEFLAAKAACHASDANLYGHMVADAFLAARKRDESQS